MLYGNIDISISLRLAQLLNEKWFKASSCAQRKSAVSTSFVDTSETGLVAGVVVFGSQPATGVVLTTAKVYYCFSKLKELELYIQVLTMLIQDFL